MTKLEKIVFNLPNAWHGQGTETVWAEPIGQNLFRIDNVPFYVFGISFNDLVEGKKDGNLFQFKKKVSSKGHSTYRILIENVDNVKWERFWKPLKEIGCSFEGAKIGTIQLLAVDIPPNVKIGKAFKLLEKGEAAGIWDFEEACVG